MSMITLICGRIIRFLHSILGFLKRVVCFWRKRDNNIGELPFTVNVNRGPSEVRSEVPILPPVVADQWDSGWEQRDLVDQKIEAYRLEQEKIRTKSVDADEGPNFFDDMAPDIKKARKVVLKPKNSGSQQSRNLFAFNSDEAVPQVPVGY
ncbi:unnamed protein product, partial [Mesorhabditis spiculigera]